MACRAADRPSRSIRASPSISISPASRTACPAIPTRGVADNIAAVAAHIEATRAIERHGVASIAEMFTGFQALPAPGATPWWQILQVQPDTAWPGIEAAFRKLAAERHPDRGGSDAMMADLNRARDEARKARGAP